MDTATIFTLTVMVLSYAVISGLVKRWYVAPALIFVLCGMALGPFGLGAIDVGTDVDNFLLPCELALTVILFNQASALDLSAVVRRRGVTFRLLVIAIPLSLVLGTVTAALFIPIMPLWEAVALAAIVAPSEVALISALLDDPRIPERVRHALSTESGFYDGFALTTLLAALAVAYEHDPAHAGWDDLVWFLLRSEVMSVVVGLVLGAVGGAVIGWSHQRGWMSDTWAQLSMLMGALLCFQVGRELDGSGLVTAFTGGLAFAFVVDRVGGRPDKHVLDAAGHLLELAIFALFGAYAVVAGWRDVGWRVVAFAVVALFGVRLIAVSVALIRTDLPVSNRLFIGWFGPRGLGTMVLGLLMIEHAAPHLEYWITQAVGVTVSLSLLVHSLTAWPGISWLATKERVEVGKVGSSS